LAYVLAVFSYPAFFLFIICFGTVLVATKSLQTWHAHG